ncbi:uncharacterized protein DEA37_0000953, partial [Paragonimus westermani]
MNIFANNTDGVPLVDAATAEQPCEMQLIYDSLQITLNPLAKCGLMIYVASEIIALTTIPIVILGTVGNLILLILLFCSSQKDIRLRIWGAALCVFDILSVNIIGLLHGMHEFGYRWWGWHNNNLEGNDHVRCKFFRLAITYLKTTRINLILFNLFTETCCQSEADQLTLEIKTITSAYLGLALLLSLILSSPTALIYGLWELHGRFQCLPDPSWASAYHAFYAVHHMLFCDGLFQCICVLSLCTLLRRKLHRQQHLHYLMRSNIKDGRLFGELLSQIEFQLNHKFNSRRILLLQSSFIGLARLVYCCVCLLLESLLFSVNGFGSQNISDRLQIWAKFSVANVFAFIELLFTTFTYVWWHQNSPQLRSLVGTQMIKTLLCIGRGRSFLPYGKRRVRTLPQVQQPTNTQPYDLEAMTEVEATAFAVKCQKQKLINKYRVVFRYGSKERKCIKPVITTFSGSRRSGSIESFGDVSMGSISHYQ